MRDSGAECAAGACALAGEGAAEAVDLGVDGRPERTYRDSVVHGVSEPAQEAVLGQSLLGQRVLRGHGGTQQRDDPEIRTVPGEGRAAPGTAAIGTKNRRTFWEGPPGVPPSGGHKAKPRSTNAVVYLAMREEYFCAIK